MSTEPTVCFFQAYNRDYIRTETLLQGLQENGVPVVLCQDNRRSPLRYPIALWKFLRGVGECDVVLANFRSFETLWLLRLLTRKPILHDAHISFWQSACEERGWFRPDSLPGRILFFMDRLNCRLSDHVLIDTEFHRDYFVRTFGVPPEKITSVYISCEDKLFFPRPKPPKTGTATTLFWSGSGIPLQGLDVLYEACKELQVRGADVVLRLAGWSGILSRLKKTAEEEGVRNIVFLGSIPRRQVIEEIAAADIGLGGHYSTIPKAAQVIAGKVYELIAMKKPVIIGDSPATRELFVDGGNALMCQMGSPVSIADAVQRLAGDPALGERLAANAHALYESRLRPRLDVLPLLPVLRQLAGSPSAGR
ncbi:MAG TPA: glycosyltransferase [Thermoanaerobaculia bacterium]|jgi:glycosyltransferase involved in cell wall biosynthesis|nr:glycosyltransferase [Thermoanaerobaculia bacterium]